MSNGLRLVNYVKLWRYTALKASWETTCEERAHQPFRWSSSGLNPWGSQTFLPLLAPLWSENRTLPVGLWALN